MDKLYTVETNRFRIMKLTKSKWNTIQIGNIVSELRNSANNPIEQGYDRYVGFEHIEPEKYLSESIWKFSRWC